MRREAATAPPAPRVGSGVVGFLFGALSVALFSGFTLASRAGLASALKPWDLMALRFGIGGIVLLPVLLRHGFAHVAPRNAFALALTGGFGFAGCAYAGFALAPATHGAVLLHGTLPLSTWLLARASGRERQRSAGLILVALGVAAMAGEGAIRSTPLQWLGDAALLLASLSWSAYGLLAKRLDLSPAHAASIVAVLSMAASLLALLALPGIRLPEAAWREWVFQAVFQGLLIGVVSLYVYSNALARIGPHRTALLTAAVPCVTTLGAIILLGESPSWFVLTGIALVTGGMLVSLLRP